jgi:hypothetical protein
MSQAAAEVRTTIDYLVPTSRINRRFWAPGAMAYFSTVHS